MKIREPHVSMMSTVIQEFQAVSSVMKRGKSVI